LSSSVTVSRALRMCSGSGAFMDVLSPAVRGFCGLVGLGWKGGRAG
jgi:hypothetical protein